MSLIMRNAKFEKPVGIHGVDNNDISGFTSLVLKLELILKTWTDVIKQCSDL